MAKLSKIVKIKQADYSTLLSEGQVTVDGVTHVYDPDALYTVVDPAAPEYADSAGYAANAGTAQVAVKDTSGNLIVQTYARKDEVAQKTLLYMSLNGTTPSFKKSDGTALTHSQVISLLDDNTKDIEIDYASSRYTFNYYDSADPNYYYFSRSAPDEGSGYSFKLVKNENTLTCELYDTVYFITEAEKTKLDNAVVLTGAQTISGNKTFSGTTTFTGATNLGSNATATTPAATDNDTSVATTAFVKTAISGKQDTLYFHCNHFNKTQDNLIWLKNDQGTAIDSIVTADDPSGAAGHASDTAIPTVDYLDARLLTKLTKINSSTHNAVVRFDGTTGNIQNSGVTINDSNQVTAAKFIKSGGTSAQFLKADGSVDSNTYLTTAPVTSVNG